MAFTYEYPRPSVTVDAVVFGLDVNEDELRVLLIQRDLEPYRGRWALPGGFVDMGESLEDAARRELKEETGIGKAFLEQLFTFGDVNRDPRGRVVSVAYYGLINLNEQSLRADTDARNAAWFALSDIPDLAFDHGRILETAHQRVKGKVTYEPIGFELLPDKFTLSQLQRVYEVILGRSLDRRNFRKKVQGMGLLVELSEIEQDVAHRAARLYRFNEQKYRQLKKNGFTFEV